MRRSASPCSLYRSTALRLLGSLLLAGLPAWGQADVLATVTGEVTDLTRSQAGELLYCTRQSDVGVVDVAGNVTVLANAASGPFAQQLVGIVEDPGGQDVAVVDFDGEVWRLVGRSTPVVHAYDDLFLIKAATDLLVDASGNYLIPFDTPSNGVRGMAWTNADGTRWSYYLRQHTPLQLAWDPVGAQVLLTDEASGGVLRSLDSSSPYRTTAVLDASTQPGYTEAADDGDMAVEANGDVLYVAGGTLYRYVRSAGTSNVVAGGYGPLRGIAIAASSGNVASGSGSSAYLAEHVGGTTRIREVGNVGAPASPIAASLGTVPGKGKLLKFFGNVQAFELTVDLQGDFLVGGHIFQAQPQVRRFDRDTLVSTIVADDSDGIAGRVEGISVAPDGTIYALTTGGIVHAITENPLAVTTVYTDAQDLIRAGQDLLLARNGKLYVADRDFFGGGDVVEIDLATGTGRIVTSLDEARAVAADPFTSDLLVTEWVGSGFNGVVNRLDVGTGTLTPVPGFQGMNYTNDSVWGDGDLAVDVFGSVYTISEDDWSLVRYDPDAQAFARVGSSYLNHPSGLVIAPSRGATTTGWSLFVSEFDFLYELENVHAPAPTRFDPAGPGVGTALGYTHPADGVPRALLPDPAGGGVLVATDQAKLVRIDLATGAATVVADALDGLAGDLVALAETGAGTVLAAAADGRIFELAPALGWTVTLRFDDAGNALEGVTGLAVDAADRPLVVDRPTSSEGGRLVRVENDDSTSVLARVRRGLRAAVDPLSAETWVTEQGNVVDGFGEILRVDALAPTPTHTHWTRGGYQVFPFVSGDGALAFFSDGDLAVLERASGRVLRLTRSSGTRQVVASGYQDPVDVVLAPGRAGNAGAQGTSLFVLDGHVVWEVGVGGLPAGPPPATDPGLAVEPDLLVEGEVTLGGFVPVRAQAPQQAGKLYAIVPSLSGKAPGVPLALLGNGSDPRVVPSNPDSIWPMAYDASVLPGFVGVLDGAGSTPAGTGFLVPNDPSILAFDTFVDLTWVVIDGSATNKVAFLGGTAQLYLGP